MLVMQVIRLASGVMKISLYFRSTQSDIHRNSIALSSCRLRQSHVDRGLPIDPTVVNCCDFHVGYYFSESFFV